VAAGRWLGSARRRIHHLTTNDAIHGGDAQRGVRRIDHPATSTQLCGSAGRAGRCPRAVATVGADQRTLVRYEHLHRGYVDTTLSSVHAVTQLRSWRPRRTLAGTLMRRCCAGRVRRDGSTNRGRMWSSCGMFRGRPWRSRLEGRGALRLAQRPTAVCAPSTLGGGRLLAVFEDGAVLIDARTPTRVYGVITDAQRTLVFGRSGNCASSMTLAARRSSSRSPCARSCRP
jgi:hypothetical protein